MIEPSKGDARPLQPNGENVKSALEQALDLCASSCLDKCINRSQDDHPDVTWMRLYAASERLRRSVRGGDAAQAILEIGSNLIGCEEMGIFGLDQSSGLTFLARSGITSEHEQALAAHARDLMAVVQADQLMFADEEESGSTLCKDLGITAFVPIWHDRRPRGAIVFYKLLPQRTGLDACDRELLELLAIFSGPSLFSTHPEKETAYES